MMIRPRRLISNTFLAAIPGWFLLAALASADDPSAPTFLRSEQLATEAKKQVLQTRLEEQLANEQAIIQLHQEGHASRAECNRQALESSALKQQIQVCRDHLAFLRDLKAASSGSESTKSVVILNAALLAESPINASLVLSTKTLDEESRQCLTQIERLNDDFCRHQQKAANVRVKLLEEQLHRERQISSDINAGQRGSLQRQIAAAKAKCEACKQQVAAIREVQIAEVTDFRGNKLSPAALVASVANHWNRNLIHSEATSLQLLADYFESSIPDPNHQDHSWTGNGRQWELHQQQSHGLRTSVSRLSAMNDRLESDARMQESDRRTTADVVKRYSELLAMTTPTFHSPNQLMELERRIHRLSTFASFKHDTETELRWLRYRHRILSAKQKQSDILTSLIRRPLFQQVSWKSSEGAAVPGVFAQSWTDPSLVGARIQSLQADLELAEARHTALKTLGQEGHASWLEVRTAKVNCEALMHQLAAEKCRKESMAFQQKLIQQLTPEQPAAIQLTQQKLIPEQNGG